ncbi:CRISPR-associated helicase Cas3' [Levilactobacillus bambusae]|uniref:CRISPR-associated helicase/endonuclease Cas3 n=1 Tax=Levilactobacillus bambusae TaxID=2024736 RepID=A0A2V1N2M3_9LACO|nr:CRISPR-associated helicase Cas3' [Levilactobacillus bambusae]PWG00486.1 CRISPR-associated helicase/endonuclease Cas3 [Levilactobacillus bambusae]
MVTDEVNALWAKKRSEDGDQLWLPLVTHLRDAQAVINHLYDHWLSDGQRQAIAGDLSDEDAHRLVKFVGFSHDLGKATPAFQVKTSYNGDLSLDHDLMETLVRNGFQDLDCLNLSSSNESPHAKAGEALLGNFKVPETVCAIIGGHHGKPENDDGVQTDLEIHTKNYYQSENSDSETQEIWRAVQRELFDEALQSSGYQSVEEVPSILQPQAVLLEGLLIMADWLASSEYFNDDPAKPLFPLIRLDQTVADIDRQGRFQNAIQTWTLDDEWAPAKVDEQTDPYQERWGFKARPVQAKMSETIGQAIDPGMAIIEAPMGIGKTEIALLAAEQMAYATGRDGVFIGLPTQATTNAMFDRAETWLEKTAGDNEASYSINLMHGKAQFNKTYQELPQAGNIGDPDVAPDAVTVNSWFSGKKSILTKFTVGTIDHLLLMGLKQKHLFLRHLGFSGKVVIIDEAHGYDAYMNKYLYKVLNWLGAYHVPVVVLSATLPAEKRKRLLMAYQAGKYTKSRKRLIAPDGWETTQAYPLLSLLDGLTLTQVSDFDGLGDQSTTEVQVSRLTLDDSELIQHVLHQIKNGGVAGLIVNTVKRAQKLAKLVPDDVELMVLHSAFLAPDRARRESELMAKIGKHADRPTKMIVIGTQVLEQSLDVDFDVMYTDIAPMDLILQRIGRLHRHDIVRPSGLQDPQLFVLGINEEGYDEGSTAVYGDYLLMKTDHFLPDQIKLPDDISPLVQAVYDPKTNDEIDGIDQCWATFQRDQKKEEQKAKGFQIGPPLLTGDRSIHGWLSRNHSDVSNSDSRAAAAVRDIKETIEVVLTQQIDGKDYLVDGRELSTVSPKVIAQQTIRIPSAVTPNFDGAIDRTIKELEKSTYSNYPDWQDSVWLKGALALTLDENNEATLGKWQLHYSLHLGLSYVKEDERD